MFEEGVAAGDDGAGEVLFHACGEGRHVGLIVFARYEVREHDCLHMRRCGDPSDILGSDMEVLVDQCARNEVSTIGLRQTRRANGRRCSENPTARNSRHTLRVLTRHDFEDIMRSALLWLIGIPIPIILILWLVTGHA